jgi:hypothetical protein
MTSDEELRKKAKKRAEEKMGFYTHFTIYILVNLLLYAIWWINHGPSTHPWPIWATLGWGIGIVAHFLGVFVGSGFEEKLGEKEYKKLKEKDK